MSFDTANLVTLAGKPLSGSQAIRFVNRAGPYPAFSPVVVDQQTDKKLRSESGYVKFKTKVTFFDGTANKTVKQELGNLWPLPTSELVDDHRPKWLLTDMRFFLRKLWVTSDFSMRRPINEFTQIQDGPLDQFSRAPKLAYIPHTQMDEASALVDSNPKFNADNNDEESGAVWTAKKACVYMLKEWP